MPTWPLRILRVRLYLSALALLAALAYGAGTEPTPVPPHPLVMAAEALYQRNLPQACSDLMRQAAMAPGLTDDDLIRLQFLTALRALDDGDDLGARRALSRAVRIDPSATPAPFASKLGQMLEEARAQLSDSSPPGDRNLQLAAARKAAAEREPAPVVLLKAVDTLYTNLQIDGAGVVLDLARVSAPPVRAQVALRQGILRMESGDEEGARAAFKEALEADRGTSPPAYTPPKTLRVFEEVKQASTVATAPAHSPRVERPSARPATGPMTAGASLPVTPSSNGVLDGSRRWGVIVGSTGLACVLGGVVVGALALSSIQAEQRASTDGDYPAYLRNKSAAYTELNVADGLSVVGVAALGVGSYLFFRAHGAVSVGASAGPGHASLAVGGHF